MIDGVTVAKAIEFNDMVKNVGASLVKQVAKATNDVTGDGNVQSMVVVLIFYVIFCNVILTGFFVCFLLLGTTCKTVLTRRYIFRGLQVGCIWYDYAHQGK